MSLTIGQRIKKRREELGLSQEELAKKLGYANRSSVNKVETSREVSIKKINSYAIALDTTVPYLMGWEDKKEIELDADLDSEFIALPKHIKMYISKFSKLSNRDQETIMSMIDRLSE